MKGLVVRMTGFRGGLMSDGVVDGYLAEPEGVKGKVSLVVDGNLSGVRLDKFVLSCYFAKQNRPPHSFLAKLARRKGLVVNGKKAELSYRVCEGDVVAVSSVFLEKFPMVGDVVSAALPEDCLERFRGYFIYENEDIVVINKPSGLAVQGGSKVKISVVTYLSSLNTEYRLVHRLDRETTGCLLIAKSRKVAVEVGEGFRDNLIGKKYLAIVVGDSGKVAGEIESGLRKNSVLKKMEVVDSADGGGGEAGLKDAKTRYLPVGTFGYGGVGVLSLLEVEIVTGRMHQIRVHLSSRGMPILGDEKYNSSVVGSEVGGMMLHALSLTYGGRSFTARPPDGFLDILPRSLRERYASIGGVEE